MSMMVLLRGGGDLASGVALRLHRAGLRLVITELPQPMAVRRLVSFSEAIYADEITIEGVTARRASGLLEAVATLDRGEIPVLVDPQAEILQHLRSLHHGPESAHLEPARPRPAQLASPASPPIVLIDARMTKRAPEVGLDAARLVIGLGPGFVAGENCHAVVETQRGHFLGRVIWQGAPTPDTGIPESVSQQGAGRVLRAPASGVLQAFAEIGDLLKPGQPVAVVGGQVIRAPFRGVLRGLIHPGISVWQGLKVGDLDPRGDPRYCTLVSDKSLAVGGGALEAILSCPDLRPYLCE